MASRHREPERTTSASDAITAAESWYEELGLTVEVTASHDFDHGSSLYGRLVDVDGAVLAEASGKGLDNDRARASLVYELAEHGIYMRCAGLPAHRAWRDGVVRDLCESDLAYLHSEAPLRVTYPAGTREVVVELDAASGLGSLAYPFELTTESTERSALLDVYYGNSGTAAGQTAADALLHALSEIAERDAVSEFLLLGCVDGEPTYAPVEQLPVEARDVLLTVASHAASPTYVVELPSSIGIPCFLAAVGGVYANGRRPIGVGCSLVPDLAIVRAATELLQEVVTIGAFPDAGPEDLAVARHLQPYPHLRACASLDMLDPLVPASFEPHASRDGGTAPIAADTSVEDLLDETLRRFQTAGLDVFWTEATEAGSPVSVVFAVAPGAERFYRVRNGFPLGPIGRHRTPERLRRCGHRLT